MDNHSHLLHIIELIEQKLKWEERSKWSNRDYIELSKKIQEETGTQLSTSSLRRIFGVGVDLPKNYTPQRDTRDALCRFIGFDSWYDYIEKEESKTERKFNKTWLFFLVPFAVAFVWLIIHKSNKDTLVSEKVVKELVFEGRQLYATTFPNTVVIKYKLKGYKKPYSIYWDDSTVDRDRMATTTILKNDSGVITHTYFDKDLSRILLQDGDKKTLATLSSYVSTQGWECFVKQGKTHFKVDSSLFVNKTSNFVTNAYLESKGITPGEPYRVFYRNNDDFGIDGGKFTFHSEFKPIFREDYVDCAHVQVLLGGTKGQFFFTLAQKGCAGVIKNINLNRKALSGEENDLSGFTLANNKWADFRVEVAENIAQIYLNGEKILDEEFPGYMGEMMCIRIEFKGNGVLKSAEYLTE